MRLFIHKLIWPCVGVALALTVLAGNKEAVAQNAENLSALDSLELKLSWLDYRLAQETWKESTGGFSDSLRFLQELRSSVFSDEVTANALKAVRNKLSDETERRRHALLYPTLSGRVLDANAGVKPLVDSLNRYFRTRWCQMDDGRYTVDQVTAVMATGRGRSNREQAYRALTSPGKQVVDLMERLFRARNQAARRHGFNDYFSYRLGLEDRRVDDYRRFLDEVEAATDPLWQRLIGELTQNYDEGTFDLWDFEYMFVNTREEAKRFFPADSQLAFVRATFDDLGFPLAKLPIFVNISTDGSRPSECRLITVRAPHDIRLVVNLVDGFESSQLLLRTMGQALFLAKITEEAPSFAHLMDPAWFEGVGEMFALLGHKSDWLQTYAHLPPGLATRLQRADEAGRLLKLRLALVNAEFVYEAFRNPNRDLNAVYWGLFEEHTGLPRHDDLTPWAARAELVMQPLAFEDQLAAGIAAAQTIGYLGKRYPGTVADQEVGSFFSHNYFRFGSRYPWPELIERATGSVVSPMVAFGR